MTPPDTSPAEPTERTGPTEPAGPARNDPSPAQRQGRPWSRLTSRGWPVGLFVLAVLVFVIYQYIYPDSSDSFQTFMDNWFSMSAINECVIWVIFALGLNVVVGYAGLLDLGYVAFWALGGYFAGWIMSPFFHQVKFSILGHPLPGQEQGIHVNFWIALPLAGCYCALWGLLIGAPTLRLKSDYLAIVTLGFGEIIPQFFVNGQNLHGFNLTNGVQGITPVDPIGTGPLKHLGLPPYLGPFNLTYKFVVFAVMAALAMFVSLRIRQGRLGRAWLAIREDELAASMMGVPLMRSKLAAYAVGAFAGGIGGVLYAEHIGGVIPDQFKFAVSITLLAMVVLGGMGNVWGVTVGALVLAWINNTGLSQVGTSVNNALGTHVNFPAYNFLIFGAILVLMMLFRREGLIPEMRTRQLLQEPERGEIESVGADLESEPA